MLGRPGNNGETVAAAATSAGSRSLASVAFALTAAAALAGGGIAAVLAVRGGFGAGSSVTALATVLAVVAFAGFGAATAVLVRTDLRERRLPNRLLGVTAALFAIPTACAALLVGQGERVVVGLLAAATGFAAAWVAWRCGAGFGGGDAKLVPVALFALGWSTGADRAVDGGLAGAFGLVAGSAILLLFARGRRTGLPFGPVLLGAGWSGIALVAFG
ncbi:prepilin peptidase [Leucobacter iarius]|uniref:Prepilin type IV endopeptidase peptidase domain-containing protein n=1 Tax=Leucobacter iarius TaxID=333963 RepID=A0ABN2LI81_9MICO